MNDNSFGIIVLSFLVVAFISLCVLVFFFPAKHYTKECPPGTVLTRLYVQGPEVCITGSAPTIRDSK